MNMNANGLKRFFVGASLVTVSIAVAAVNIPNTFTAGQPIKAAEVNANFSSLKSAVDTLEAGKFTSGLDADRAQNSAIIATSSNTSTALKDQGGMG